MLIEVPLEGPFPETIEFIKDYGVVVKQTIHFISSGSQPNATTVDGLDMKAKIVGKKGARKEWRVVHKSMTESNAEEAVQGDQASQDKGEGDGFTEVTRRSVVRRHPTQNVETCQISRPYEALQILEGVCNREGKEALGDFPSG